MVGPAARYVEILLAVASCCRGVQSSASNHHLTEYYSDPLLFHVAPSRALLTSLAISAVFRILIARNMAIASGFTDT